MNDKELEFKIRLKKDKPEMMVMCIKKYVDPEFRWPTERKLAELTPEEFNEFNLIKQNSNQIVFDVEKELDVPTIKEKLKTRGWKFEQWWTGSRGMHFIVEFENLADLPIEVRNRVRRYFIKDIGTDEALSRENQWMACPYALHMKTGNQKYLFDTYVPDVPLNKISDGVIRYCIEELENEKRLAESPQELDEDFSKFHEDPFLNYVLTHDINQGERNNVVFKNLAIGLVKAGYSIDKIRQVAEAIVARCPGKHLNEFMGWVDKAVRGELREYNKAEIVAWALKHQLPPFYDMVIEIDDINKLSNFKQLWDLLWNHRIACQDVWKDMCFYNMLSSALDEKDEDYRVHVLFSCVSGSGKDEGLTLVFDTLKKMNREVYTPAMVTDKTLIGGINQQQMDMNTKYGLSAENTTNGKRSYRDPREPGILANAAWMGYGEAETVLKPYAYNKQVQLILRQAMDRKRTIQKGVGNLMIDLYTNTVFAFTTYPLPDIVMKIINNGLFQRMIFFHKNLSVTEHDIIQKHIQYMKYDPVVKSNFKEDQIMNLMIQKIEQAILWYKENKDTIRFSNDTAEYVYNKWKAFEREYSLMESYDVTMLNSIVRRAGGNLHKLAILTAIAKKKIIVSHEDIDEAFEFLSKCILSIRDLLLNVTPEKKKMLALLLALRESNKSSMTIHKELEQKANMKSPNMRTKLIGQAKLAGYIMEIEDGRYTYLSLTPKGKEEIGEE